MIYFYEGKLGDGKTYHVVRQELLGAVAKGRRIYTNIDGLNTRAISQMTGCPEWKINITRWESVSQIRALLTLDNEDKQGASLKIDMGSVVILDEAQMIYRRAASKEIPKEFYNLLEYHRHFGMDFVFIAPHHKLCAENLILVVNESYKVKNLKIFGDWLGQRYIIQVRPTCGGTVMTTLRGKYDPGIFACYKSAVEMSRHKHSTPSRVRTVLIVSVLLLGYGISGIARGGGLLSSTAKAAKEKNAGNLGAYGNIASGRQGPAMSRSVSVPSMPVVERPEPGDLRHAVADVSVSSVSSACHVEVKRSRLVWRDETGEGSENFERDVLICSGGINAQGEKSFSTAVPSVKNRWRESREALGEGMRDSVAPILLEDGSETTGVDAMYVPDAQEGWGPW